MRRIVLSRSPIVHRPPQLRRDQTVVPRQSRTSVHMGASVNADHIKSIQKRDEFARKLFAEIDAGLNPDLNQLRGVSGVRFEPTSWEELVEAIEDGRPEALARLGRSPLALKHYWDETREIKTKLFVSMIDNLYARIFNLPTERDPDGRQRAIVPPDFQEKETIVWKANDYPYWYEPGIEHHCIWCSHPLSEEQINQVIAEHRGPEYETIWFKNPPVLQSCPQIWHVHVLSRPAKKSGDP